MPCMSSTVVHDKGQGERRKPDENANGPASHQESPVPKRTRSLGLWGGELQQLVSWTCWVRTVPLCLLLVWRLTLRGGTCKPRWLGVLLACC